MNKAICFICGLEIKWMDGIMIFSGQQPNQEMVEIHKNCANEVLAKPEGEPNETL